MKTINAIVKILTALAAIAGAVYIVATYGDTIVSWAKDLWKKISSIKVDANVTVEVPASEEAAEQTEAPVAETAEETVAETAEEAPAEEAAVEEAAPAAAVEGEPVADEADFEG